MRVGGCTAVTREMFEHRRDPGFDQPVGHRTSVARHNLWVIAERPAFDAGARSDIEHRTKHDLDAKRAHTRAVLDPLFPGVFGRL